jgi:hypothetical protein
MLKIPDRLFAAVHSLRGGRMVIRRSAGRGQTWVSLSLPKLSDRRPR